MAQRLEQTQTTAQVQQLSALQVAVAKLVELPITELASRIQDEMVDNAALEEREDGDTDDLEPADSEDERELEADDAESGADDEEKVTTDNEDYTADEYGAETDAISDYLTADDVPDYLQQRAEEQRDRTEMQMAGQASFYDELQSQMGEHNLSEHEKEIIGYLIGSLDEDGFLRKDLRALADELAIYHNTETTPDELERLLAVLQTFEPRGIGARSLQECLHIQLTDPDRRTPYTPLALKVVDKYFKDFAGRKWDVIGERLGADSETLQHVRHELTHLNPLPGRALSETAAYSAPTVVPDFYVRTTEEGEVQVTLNNGEAPELRVSPAFRDSLKQYGAAKSRLTRQQQDAYTYARQKVDAAVSFLNLLERRKHTLLSVMQGIVHFQRPFFLEDDDETLLRPLTLKEVAEHAGLDISTVSRVTSNKYVQTFYGTYPLKFFFSSQFTTTEGDELSARQVRAALRELIEAEDKSHPLTDETLTSRLKEQGYNVARRTVAKYRDLLGFPTARLRRESGA